MSVIESFSNSVGYMSLQEGKLGLFALYVMTLLLVRKLKILPMHLRLDQMGYKAFIKFDIN